MAQIHATLPDSKKKRWDKLVAVANDDLESWNMEYNENVSREEAVDDLGGDFAEIDSLADLVRTGVELYIANAGSSSEGNNDEVIRAIEQSTNRLISEVNDVETEVKALRQDNVTPDEMEQIMGYVVEETVREILRNQLKQQLSVGAMPSDVLKGDDDDS